MRTLNLHALVGWILLLSVDPVAAWDLDTPPDQSASCYVENYNGSRRFIGGTSGLWRSDDFGQTWTSMNAHISINYPRRLFRIELLSVDSLADTVIVRCLEIGRTYKTFDGGETWTPCTPPYNSGKPPLICVPEGDSLAWLMSWREQIRSSVDHGATWQLLAEINGVDADVLIQSKQNPLRFYWQSPMFRAQGFVDGGLFVSNDAGATWTPLMASNPFFDSFEVLHLTSFCELSNGTLISCISTSRGTEDWGDGLLVFSSDEGQSWTRPVGTLPYNFNPEEIVEANGYPRTIIVGAYPLYGIYRSTDFGQSWSHIDFESPRSRQICNFLYSNPYSGDLVASADPEGTFRSTDGGLTWVPEPTPPTGAPDKAESIGNIVIAHDYNHGRMWARNPDLHSWRELVLPYAQDTACYYYGVQHIAGNEWAALLRLNPMIGDYYAGVMKVVRSHDDGQTWTMGEQTPFGFTYGDWFTFDHALGSTTLNLSRHGDSLHVSSDGLNNWQSYSLGGYQGNFAVANDRYVIINTENFEIARFIVGSPGGEEWAPIEFTLPEFWSYVTSLTSVLLDGELYVLPYTEERASKLYRWNGLEWDSSSTLPTYKFQTLDGVSLNDRHILFAMTQHGEYSYISIDSGNTWTQIESEFPYEDNVYSIYDTFLQHEDDHVIAWVSTGAGLMRWDLTDVIAPVSDQRILVPTQLNLSVYPNPTNGAIRIQIDLPTVTQINLRMYDILGRRVADVFSGRTGSKIVNHTVAPGIASGVYFLRLEADSKFMTHKIAYLK